jgi:methanogenic corrinoid protein MtbC1
MRPRDPLDAVGSRMRVTNWDEARKEYFDHLEHPDVRAGAAIVARLLDAGEPIATVVEEVLGPAQLEVGRRWQTNEWSVADEHAASAVTETALMVAAAMRTRGIDPACGAVVLACAPGEWHTIPLRMLSEVLAEAGFDCHFLGGSVPASHLRRYLDKVRPVALALACTSPVNLDGAAAAIVVAHAAGVPVLAGGRGFGSDDQRARMMGADGWTDKPAGAVELLTRWAESRKGPELHAGHGVADALNDVDLGAIRGDVVARLLAQFPQLSGYTAEDWVRTRDDVDLTIGFALMAARLCDDRIFTDFVAWLGGVHAARHVPPAVLTATLFAIAASLVTRQSKASALVGDAARAEVLAATRPV